MNPLTFDLITQISGQMRSNLASTFYIAGSVRSGKTKFLQDLPDLLRQTGLSLRTLGPYTPDWDNLGELSMCILEDCCRLDLLDEHPNGPLSLHEVWTWYAQQSRGANRAFLILLDLGDTTGTDIHKIATLLSDLRRFEGEWIDNKISPHFVLVGHWNPIALRDYYRQTNISFPYSRTHNFALWHGVSPHAIFEMIPIQVPAPHKIILAQVLHELTGGHPAACREVLSRIPSGRLNLRSILKSLRQTAQYGEVAAALVDSWRGLPPTGKVFLATLIHSRQTSSAIWPALYDLLNCLGLVREVHVGSNGYLGFRSWLVELIVRIHANDLGLDHVKISSVSLDNLVPEVSVINRTAYEAINDIENQVRNFAVIQRSLHTQLGENLLDVRVKPIGRNKGKTNLEKEVAKRKKAAGDADLPTEINPGMTFLFTKELAAFLVYLAEVLDSPAWVTIANSVEELNPLRNAVMHNQLVDLEQLDKLLTLRADIYRELDRTRS